MTYTALMAHLEVGHSNAHLLGVVKDLAERFHSRVIGIAACQPLQMVYSDDFIPADLVRQDLEQIDKDIKATELEFRSAFGTGAGGLGWRSMVTFGPLSDYVAREARSADLVVMRANGGDSSLNTLRHAYLSDLVMRAGRPILVVPAKAAAIRFDRVLVGWKDTRETRRAIVDALPLLKKAAYVAVAEIADESELADARKRVEEVAAWLKGHGVPAESMASLSTGNDAQQLSGMVEAQGADLLVAGAYAHSRVREWVLGGVTRDLLLRGDQLSLVSH